MWAIDIEDDLEYKLAVERLSQEQDVELSVFVHHKSTLRSDHFYDHHLAEPYTTVNVRNSDYIVIRALQKEQAQNQSFSLTFFKPDESEPKGGSGGKIAAAVIVPLLVLALIALVCYIRCRNR